MRLSAATTGSGESASVPLEPLVARTGETDSANTEENVSASTRGLLSGYFTDVGPQSACLCDGQVQATNLASVGTSQMDEEAGICKACGEQGVIWDTDHGHAICRQCGTVDDGLQFLAELNVEQMPTQASWSLPQDPLSRHTQSRLHSVRGKQWHLMNNLASFVHDGCLSLTRI